MKQSDIFITKALPAHLEQIMRIENECINKGYIFPKRSLKYLISNSKGVFFVALNDNKVCGYVSVLSRKNSSILRIYNIAVSPLCRRMGIGSMLVEYIIKYMETSDMYNMICAEIKTDNVPSILLFKNKGFKQTGLLKNYYGKGSDAEKVFFKLR